MGFKRDGVDQMLGIFVLACMTGKSDTASVLPSNKPSEEPSVEPATEPNLPDDVDSDGYTEEAGDCDDWNPLLIPVLQKFGMASMTIAMVGWIKMASIVAMLF